MFYAVSDFLSFLHFSSFLPPFLIFHRINSSNCVERRKNIFTVFTSAFYRNSLSLALMQARAIAKVSDYYFIYNKTLYWQENLDYLIVIMS